MNTRILSHPTRGDQYKEARWFVCLPFPKQLAIPEDPVSSKHPGASDTEGGAAAVVWEQVCCPGQTTGEAVTAGSLGATLE